MSNKKIIVLPISCIIIKLVSYFYYKVPLFTDFSHSLYHKLCGYAYILSLLYVYVVNKNILIKLSMYYSIKLVTHNFIDYQKEHYFYTICAFWFLASYIYFSICKKKYYLIIPILIFKITIHNIYPKISAICQYLPPFIMTYLIYYSKK